MLESYRPDRAASPDTATPRRPAAHLLVTAFGAAAYRRPDVIVISLDASTPGIPERVRHGVVRSRDAYEGAEAADPGQDRPSRWSGITPSPVAVQRAMLAEVRRGPADRCPMRCI